MAFMTVLLPFQKVRLFLSAKHVIYKCGAHDDDNKFEQKRYTSFCIQNILINLPLRIDGAVFAINTIF